MIEVVKEFFPDVTDEMADMILWSETSFPFFPGRMEGDSQHVRIANIKIALEHYRMQLAKYALWLEGEFGYRRQHINLAKVTTDSVN